MNPEIRTAEDLYRKVKPALYSKMIELKKLGIDYIKENDIWNYLTKTIWSRSNNLSLSEVVSDILNLNTDEIKNYVLNFLRKEERKADIKDGELL